MSSLPTGTVTFLFTDLEGSTRLWEEHPEAMRAALARHNEILHDAVEQRDGHVVRPPATVCTRRSPSLPMRFTTSPPLDTTRPGGRRADASRVSRWRAVRLSGDAQCRRPCPVQRRVHRAMLSRSV